MSPFRRLALVIAASLTVAACGERSAALDRPVIAAARSLEPCPRKVAAPPRILTTDEVDWIWRRDRDRLEDCADRHDALIAAVRRRGVTAE